MANFNLFKRLDIRLPGYEYPVLIGHNALADEAMLRTFIQSKQVFIVTNETLAPLYLHDLQNHFLDRQCDSLILKDGEAYKNQESLNRIYDALISKQHHRDTTLIALGGGVVGDMTGFAAATYQRGVNFVQIPTSLLAQVDASIGGKTAINHSQGKNMIGSFHQPQAVIIDLNCLKTLPLREFRAGLAEIIKTALLAGGELFDRVFKALDEGLADNRSQDLAEIIFQSCRYKAILVEEDVHEQGQRALLNLGHTFAHALEAYTHYDRWLHGEAVAIGLYCAALLSHQFNHLDKQSLTLVDQLLIRAHLPHRIPSDIDLSKLRALMSKDKKIKNQCLRFILMKAIGSCYVEDKVTEEDLDFSLKRAVEGIHYAK